MTNPRGAVAARRFDGGPPRASIAGRVASNFGKSSAKTKAKALSPVSCSGQLLYQAVKD